MTNHLGPIDISCDAPPYPIVQACKTIGIRTPEDVRWVRMSHFTEAQQAAEVSQPRQISKKILGLLSGEKVSTCGCGERLPKLGKYRFTFSTGEELYFLLGQCGRCRGVYWEEA